MRLGCTNDGDLRYFLVISGDFLVIHGDPVVNSHDLSGLES